MVTRVPVIGWQSLSKMEAELAGMGLCEFTVGNSRGACWGDCSRHCFPAHSPCAEPHKTWLFNIIQPPTIPTERQVQLSPSAGKEPEAQ